VALFVDNERWRGVPFILKSGKALNEKKSEIRIQFKQPDNSPFPDCPANELVIRISPNEAIYMKINTKTPGLVNDLLETELDLTYRERYEGIKIPGAYERLILDVIKGEHQYFVRRDELALSWKIWTPFLHEIEGRKVHPIEYPYGSRGPAESDDFVNKFGYRRSETYQWKK